MTPDITALRLRLRRGGFHPIPVEGKRPPLERWSEKLNTSDDEIRLWAKTWHLAHNTGVLAKFTPGLDIDVMIEPAAKAVEDLAREFFEEHGDIHVRFGLPPKRLIPLRTDEPFKKLRRVFTAPDGSEHKLELLGDGQQYVVAGIHPDTGKPYRWFGGELTSTPRESLPYVRIADAERFIEAATKLLTEEHGFILKSATQKDTNGGNPHEAGEQPQAPVDLIAAALTVIPNNADWDGWSSIAMATWRATGGSAVGFDAFDAWSKKSPKYNARTTAEKWAVLFKSPPTHIGAGTIFYLANEVSPDWREEHDACQADPQPQPSPQPGPQPQPQPRPGSGSPPPPPPPSSGRPQPQPGPQPGPQPTPTPLGGLGEWNAGDDVDLPSPRGWLLGNVFCRTFLSSVLGSGGVGKTALRYAQALSLATGRSLTGEYVFQRCRVLIISLEDDASELRRRILAARLHHNIALSELDGWLFLAAPGAKGGKLLEMDKRGRVKEGALRANLEAAIIAHKIDLVMLDPFVKTHAVEENLNSAIDDVAQVLTDLATKHDVAIDAPHHVRKGQMEAGDADAGRGASALIAAARLVYTCLPMSEDEAQTFGINPAERRDYIRVDSGKVNIARASRNAKWFRLINVPLGNPTAQYPAGDEVQTVMPWEPPQTWAYLSVDLLNAILDKITAGLPDGTYYSDANAAGDRAAWKVVCEMAPSKTMAQGREIIRTWVKNGVLVAFDYVNQVTRNAAKGLRLDPSKRPT